MLMIVIILSGLNLHSQNSGIELTIPQIKKIRIMVIDLNNADNLIILLTTETKILKQKINTLEKINKNYNNQFTIIDSNYSELAEAFTKNQEYIDVLEISINKQQRMQKIMGSLQYIVIVGVLTLLIVK